MARLGRDDSFVLGYVDDLRALLGAIDEALPKDAVLYLEGTAIAPEIGAFLTAHAAPEGLAIAANTLWPAPTTYRMSLAGSNLAGLRALAERFEEPGVCDHVVVYRGGELLLWAHDASDGWLQVARSLPADTVEQLRRALGAALKPPPETDMSGV